ncbi:MAG: ABC transporter permease [Candidatus Dojkabacteria bacterium]|nr:ABC transporter permease [Candidatus Dojkabacteria bacterium]MDQ7021596.1 ABC transporter permease [Candidatus Dojkabacteria bacterium]
MNDLRQIKTFFISGIIATLKNPVTIFFGVFFPLIFVAAFGYANTNNLTLDIVVSEKSNKNNFVYRELSKISFIELIDEKDAINIDKKLSTGELDGYLNLTKFRDDMVLVNLEVSSANSSNETAIKSILQGIIDNKNINTLKTKSDTVELPSQISFDIVGGVEYKHIDFILPGQIALALTNFGILGTAYLFFTLKKNKVLKKLSTTPVKKLNFFLGEGLSRLTFGLFQVSIIVLIGIVFFDFYLSNGSLTFLLILMISALSISSFMGLGILIAGLVKNERSFEAILSFVILPQVALSGTFFDLELYPDWMKFISNLLPLTYINKALREVSFYNANLIEIAPEIIFIVLSGTIFYILALKFFKWD